jgi:hypothetical protein
MGTHLKRRNLGELDVDVVTAATAENVSARSGEDPRAVAAGLGLAPSAAEIEGLPRWEATKTVFDV